MNRAVLPSLALRKKLSCFFQLLVANNIPCGCITPSSAHLHMTSFVSFSFSVCLTRTPVSGFGAHMDNPENFPGGAMVKNLPANAGDMRDTGSIPGLGRSPRGGNATHSRILAWIIPWTEEPGGLQSRGSQRVQDNLLLKYLT